MLTALVRRLEEFLFRRRGAVLAVFALLTVLMGWEASKLRISAGFDKLLPSGHEYIKTFDDYRGQLHDANGIAVVVHPRHGDVWNAATLKTLYDVTPGRKVTAWVTSSRVFSVAAFHTSPWRGCTTTAMPLASCSWPR